MRRILFAVFLTFLTVAIVESCGYDSSLREYLNRHFWLPFAKHDIPFERKSVRRVSAPFAGMDTVNIGNDRLAGLRSAYQQISSIDGVESSPYVRSDTRTVLQDAVLAARQAWQQASADRALAPQQREEVALLDAKIDMREGELAYNDPATLRRARQKLQAFLRSTRNRAFASEARGWIAHVDFLLGDEADAGKLYLDELNRDGSNLSRETILNSLRVVYGYGGGTALRDHIAEYFDSPEHAAFAIQLITNPQSKRAEEENRADAAAYKNIMRLAEQHRVLFDSADRSEALTLLLMRTALRMGDPESVIKIVEMIPKDSALLENVDLNWMKASAHFVLHDYRSAEQPLLKMFQSDRASRDDKAAAAYGLVGVYEKLKDPIEQLHYALWLRAQQPEVTSPWNWPGGTGIEDRTVYWAPSGWDLGALLDYQLSDETLTDFIKQYPDLPQLRLVRYALAVRMAREDRYAEAADMYISIGATTRGARMRQLADLFARTKDQTLSDERRMEAQYRFAEFLSNNSERVYFNDTLWAHFQNDALTADDDVRLTKDERDNFVSGERNLRDVQEERWRAYLILNQIMNRSGKNALGQKSARLALRCLRGIATQRFGRADEIQAADIRLSAWLSDSKR